MNSEKRIEELEAEVRHLTQVVEQLLEKRGPVSVDSAPAPPAADAGRRPYRADASRNVDKVLGGAPGEALESRIGGIWLGRVALVLLMTAAVLGARLTLRADVLDPWHKVAIGYAASLLAIAYGMRGRNENRLFAQAVFGAGLAGIHFTTYAAFFMEGVAVFPNRLAAIPVLLGCLAVIAGVAAWKRSQTVAGMALFLSYYTIAMSGTGNVSPEGVYYALAACALIALAALIFHALHRWLLFTWIALIATQATYLYFFWKQPPGLAMTPRGYFWISNGMLALCWVLFSSACVIDARRTGEYRKTVAPMSGVNSFVFLVLAWWSIHDFYPEDEWKFRLGFAAALLFFAIMADRLGARRNYLFQVFAAKAVIMFTLALEAYLRNTSELFVVAMALECLALALSFKRSGVIIFKLLALGLAILTFGGGLINATNLRLVHLANYTIGANWFCGVGVTAIFLLVAGFYVRYIRRVHPDHRVVSGQWFLADTAWDISSENVALFHASLSALLLLAVTILDQGDRAVCPFLLAGEGAVFGIAAVILRTPQAGVGGVLLVLAAHVNFYVFLAFDLAGFDAQPHFSALTMLLALLTWAAAPFWERRVRHGFDRVAWPRGLLGAAPHLAGTVLLATLMQRKLAPVDVPAAAALLGAVLMAASGITRQYGLKTAAFLAYGFGMVQFAHALGATGFFAPPPERYLAAVVAATGAIITGERLRLLRGRSTVSMREDAALGIALTVFAAGMAVLGLAVWAPRTTLTLYWLLTGTLSFGLGAAFRASYYRWTALGVIALAITRAFWVDLRGMPLVYAFLTFTGLALTLLGVSWMYARRRQRAYGG